jgi:hypothetical protein
MGDRTNVTLTVLSVDAERTEDIFLDAGWSAANSDASDPLSTFDFEDVNYGDLTFLDTLAEQGIPCDSAWDSGGEHGAGTQSLRFTPEGEAIEKTVYDSEHSVPLIDLLVVIDDPAALRQMVLHRQLYTTILPWDNQAEYAKLRRIRQLIHVN